MERKRILVNWYGFRIEPGNIPLPLPGVYLVTNLETGKQYVGASRNIESRFVSGWRQSVKMTKPSLLAADFIVFGMKSFLVAPIYYSFGLEGLDHAEESLIRDYKVLYPNGYNAVLATKGVAIFRAIDLDPRLAAARVAGITAYMRSAIGRDQSAARMTDEHKLKLNAARKMPEAVALRRAIFNGAEFKDKISEASRRAWSDPLAAAQRSAAVRGAWADPALREAQSARLKAHLSAPDAREQRKTQLAKTADKATAARRAVIDGSSWITDGEKNRRLGKGLPIPEGWRKGRSAKQ